MRIACLIPAYNEAGRLKNVLKVVAESNIFDEVVVIDDGSTDDTYLEAHAFKVKLISKYQNEGKGAAIMEGIHSYEADIYVLLDADLVGLTEDHIKQLLEPLFLDDDLIMTIGVFSKGRIHTDLPQKIVPFTSGQRAFKKEFLNGLSDFSQSGYGVEVVFSRHLRKNKLKFSEIELRDLSQVIKEEKLGFQKGFSSRVEMYWHMFRNMLGIKKTS